jgi:U3 small nucleolar RNA-associated protein 19
MVAVGFVHNLVRRHPSCMVLLHRPLTAAEQQQQQQQQQEEGEGRQQQGPGHDPYDEAEPDPAQSRAVESSLWEVEALRRHYCPQVATLTAVLDKDLSDRAHTSEVDLDPLLATSYASLIASEAGRRLKAAPVAFYARPPAGLFCGGGGGGGGGGAEGEEGQARASEAAAAAAGNGALLAPLPGWDLEAPPEGGA